MISQGEMGSRVRNARESARVSQADLAAAVGINRSAMTRIESGERALGALEISLIARVLGRSLDHFLEADIASEDVLLRADAANDEDRGVLGVFLDFCRSYAQVERLLWGEIHYDIPVHAPLPRLRAIEQGEHLAKEERKRLGIGDDPVGDMSSLIEEQGVRLFRRRLLDSGIMGAFHYSEELGPCVFINTGVRESRQSFSAAHEYCHFLIDRRMKGYACPRFGAVGKKPHHEIRANSFAAAFLMPEQGIRRLVAEYGFNGIEGVAYLQHFYGVSKESLLYRLLNLGIINKSEQERFQGMSTEVLKPFFGDDCGDTTQETGEPSAFGKRFVSLVIQAYRLGKISATKLAELLNLQVSEARDMLVALGG
ncbi:MAG: XRE family transcriptional regulator [Actinobacteria bacterium]|nr:XRE family transcriptional regulator [Actinomycetota bacterium]